MKKTIFGIIVATVASVLLVGCSSDLKKMDPYEPSFMEEAGYEFVIDDYMAVDGVLDESVWANRTNTITATSSLPRGGKMDVTTHFGEKGVYIAFEVSDPNLNFEPTRSQTDNSGVESYFGPLESGILDGNCYSIRINPTDSGGVVSSIYDGSRCTSWKMNANKNNFYKSAATVDGTFNDGENDNGYVVECAFSYDLIGGKTDKLNLTAAFIQTDSAIGSVNRDANTFVPGTSYIRASLWKGICADGMLDKNAYLDGTVTIDEGFTLDGKLDEAAWQSAIDGGKGMSFGYNGSVETLSGASYTIYTHYTDAGAYIGIDSTDKYVFAPAERAVNANTGIELIVAGRDANAYATDTVKKIIFSVDGRINRYDAYADSSVAWTAGQFPVKAAGSAKNGEINSADTDGWQGEIFLPWRALGVTRDFDKNVLSILPLAVRHSTSATASAKILNPVETKLSTDGRLKIRQSFLRFDADGFKYYGLGVTATDVDTNNVATKDGQECYYVDLDVSYNNVITGSGFYTQIKKCDVTAIESEFEYVAYEKIDEGKYRLYIKQTDVNLFKGAGQEFDVKGEGSVSTKLSIKYDVLSKIDGVIDANDIAVGGMLGTNKSITVDTTVGAFAVKQEVAAAVQDGSIYFTMKVTDQHVLDTSTAELYICPDGQLTTKAVFFKFFADGRVSASAYRGTTVWEIEDAYSDALSYAIGKTSDGYIVEGRFPLSAIRMVEADGVSVLPVVTFCVNSGKGIVARVSGDKYFTNDIALSSSNYLYFDKAEGFKPRNVFPINNKIILVDGETITGNDTDGYVANAEVEVSYLPFGGLATDTVVPISFTTPAGEKIRTDHYFEYNGITARVEIVYVKPDKSAFDASKLTTLVNFDHHNGNVIGEDAADYLEVKTDGCVSADPIESDYDGDKAFTANQKKRWLRIPYTFGDKDFTISAMVNTDDLVKWHAATYAHLVFGTGNVDQKTGFSLQISESSWYVRVPGRHYVVGNYSRSKLRDGGYQRLTFTVQRTGIGAVVSLWLGGELQFSIDTAFTDSLDIPEYGKLGVGAPGSYKESTGYADVDIIYDDIVIYEGVLDSAQEIFDMQAYIDDINEKSNFGASETAIRFSFAEMESVSSLSKTFSITKGNELIDRGVTFTGEWSDSIVNNGDGTYTFTMTKADAANYAVAKSCGYTYNGFTKYVTVSYDALSALVTDKSSYEYVVSEQGDYYNIKIKLTNQSGTLVNLSDVYFRSPGAAGVIVAQSKIGDGIYLIQLDKAKANAKDVIELEVRLLEHSGVTACGFAAVKVELTADEKTALGEKLMAVVTYDGSNGISNLMGGSTSMTATNSAYPNNGVSSYELSDGKNSNDKYFTADTLKNRMVLDGISLGKEDFTIAFDAKIGSQNYSTSNAYTYELITSTLGTSDFNPSTLQISVFAPSNTLRIQVGRNDGQYPVFSSAVSAAKGNLRLDEWVSYVVVVDRNVRTVEGRTRIDKNYTAQGEYSKACNDGKDKSFAYLAEEDVTVTVYADGVLAGSMTFQLSGQDLGYNGKLFVGGNFASGGKSLVTGFDNIVVLRGTVTENEVKALPYVCADLV